MGYDDWMDHSDDNGLPVAYCAVCDLEEEYFRKVDLKAQGWVCFPPQGSKSGQWDDVCPDCLKEYREEVRAARAKQAADLFKPAYRT